MLSTQLKLARLWQLVGPCQQLLSTLSSHELPLSAAAGILQQLVPADDGAESPSTPPTPLCSPQLCQQLSQQLQVILDCLFQGLQAEGVAEQLQQVVGSEVLDQVVVEHEHEVGGMQEQQDMVFFAKQATADRGNERQGRQVLAGDGVTSVGGTAAGGGGLVAASTAASPTKRMKMTLPADPASVLGLMGPLQAAAAATVAVTPAAVADTPLDAPIAGLAQPSVKAQKASPVAKQRPAKGAEVMGGSCKQPKRVRSPTLWPSNSHEALPAAIQVAADAGGNSGGGGGSGSGPRRTGHTQIQLPKNWETSGNKGTGAFGQLDMGLDTLAKLKKGGKGGNPQVKQPQHQKDGPRNRVPPARMALEGMGGSGFGGHGRGSVAGQQQQQQGSVQGRSLLDTPRDDGGKGLPAGQGVAAADGVVAMRDGMDRGVGEGGGVGVGREGPPGPGCRPTPALRWMSNDQQQAFVVEVAALLRIAVRERQARGHGNTHPPIVEFLKLCEECHPNVGRLLSGGHFNRAVGFFLCHPEVFEVQQMLLRAQPWDPVHWKAGRERSPDRFSAPREQKLVVGLKQGGLGEIRAGLYLLWVNERGQRLGEELQERVLGLVKQRGLWEGALEEQRQQGRRPGRLSLEEVLQMVPEDIKHYVQVRKGCSGSDGLQALQEACDIVTSL